MKYTLLSIVFLVFLVSCVESEKPDVLNPNEFKVTSIDYLGEGEKLYAILHDENGVALDYKRVRNGETVSFQIDQSKNYLVSTYFIRDYEYGRQEVMATREIKYYPFGMRLQKGTPSVPAENGKFRVIVTGDEPLGYYVTARGVTSEYSYITNTYDQYMKLFADEKRYLVVASQGGNSRYAYIDNPERDKTYTLSYAEMSDFEKTISWPRTDYLEYHCQVYSMGTKNGQAYQNFVLKNGGYYNPLSGTEKLGYIGGIDTFMTSVSGRRVSSPEVQFHYFKHGSAPDQIEILDIDEIRLASKSVADFEFETRVEGAIYHANFQSKKNQSYGQSDDMFFTWSIEGEKPTFTISLPEGLVAAEPLMLSDFSELYLARAEITKNLAVSSSSDLIATERTSVSQYFRE